MSSEYVWPASTSRERRDTVATIAWTIYEQGPFQSEDGRATALVAEALDEAGLEITGSYLNKTLADMHTGIFGGLISRDIDGKRTYVIECAVDPYNDPFPHDPRKPQADYVINENDETETEPTLPGMPTTKEDHIIEADIIHDTTQPQPATDLDYGHSTEIATVEAPGTVDKILYIVSLLNEIVADELVRPQKDFAAQLGEQLTAVNTILEENRKLKAENENLKRDKNKLAELLNQSNRIMRDRANGTQAVHA